MRICWSDRLNRGCRQDFDPESMPHSALCHTCKDAYWREREEVFNRAREVLMSLSPATNEWPKRENHAFPWRITFGEDELLGKGFGCRLGQLKIKVVPPVVPGRYNQNPPVFEVYFDDILVTGLWLSGNPGGLKYLEGRVASTSHQGRMELYRLADQDVYALGVATGSPI